MALTWLQLTNRLRDRLNEVRLNSVSWGSTVGFDQFTKDAINYAYNDIMSEEAEWPFLHQADSFLTDPGQALYVPSLTIPSGFNSSARSIDWEGFYISDNYTDTQPLDNATIPSTAPYTVTIENYDMDGAVVYSPSLTAFTKVETDPAAAGEFNVIQQGTNAVFYFNSADAGVAIAIGYDKTVAPVSITPVNKTYLKYIDYDFWRQNLMERDANFRGMPRYVFKPQVTNQIGLSPCPDKVYRVNLEFYLEATDLASLVDSSIMPARYDQIIIDGALKYCYEFREDPQMSKMAEERFLKGIRRMRIELINKPETMKTGFHWRPTA